MIQRLSKGTHFDNILNLINEYVTERKITKKARKKLNYGAIDGIIKML